jgi:Uma2 family endonuclease
MVLSHGIYFTPDMVLALPYDGNTYVCVFGELLVSAAPRPCHAVHVKRVGFDLDSYLCREPVGELIGSRSDISWDRDVLIQPDLFVVLSEEARTLDWARMKTLLLVVEVLSPSSLRYDRFTKRRRYQEAGVPVYWIVDGDQGIVEVWTPEARFPSIEREQIEWRPAGSSTRLVLPLKTLFRPI